MEPVRGAWAWAWGMAGGILAGWGCGSAFSCQDDSQCQGGPSGGVCAQGSCAFPADDCDSGLRWGEHAGGQAGVCVPAAGDTDPLDPTDGPPGGTQGSGSGASEGSLDTTEGDSGDGPIGGEVEFRDDALEAEFGAGTMQDVEWVGDRLALVEGATQGTFTSRVFDAEAPAQWQTAQWMPEAPYGKPLPDGGGSEAGYEVGAVSMADNVLLMHLDGDGVWNDGTEVPDASGAGSHGTVVSDGGPIALVPGVFGAAIDDHAASRISIPTKDATALAFGEDDFTWSMWFRMDEPCTENHVYLGVDNSDMSGDLGPHLWLGCTNDPWDECPGNGVRAGGVLRSEHSNQTDGTFYCSTSQVDGDQWHHVLVVKEGHVNGTVRFYVDGELEYQGGSDFAAPIEYPDEPDFTIGAFSRGTYPAVGVFDEVAIWRRALSGDEAVAVYQRGANGMRVTVRSCVMADCADDPPWGPALVDPPEATGPGSELELAGVPVGRFVQYRVAMTGGGAKGPALRSVTIRGQLF